MSYKPVPKIVFNCGYCGILTESRAKKRLLCKACSERDQRRLNKSRKRTKLRTGESISPFDIFTRDNWHCRRCNVHTPPHLRSTHEPNAPEMDHIIPVSKGGLHTWMNLQCLCRICNNKKSDSIKEIVPIIGNFPRVGVGKKFMGI